MALLAAWNTIHGNAESIASCGSHDFEYATEDCFMIAAAAFVFASALLQAAGQPPSTAASTSTGEIESGVSSLRAQQYDAALNAFKIAYAHGARSATLENLMGIAETGLGNVPQAEAHYRKAIAMDPRMTAPLKNLGVSELNAGKYPAAEIHLKQALQLTPSDSFVHAYLATVYLDTSRDLQAVAELPKARDLVEHDTTIAVPMALACIHTGHADDARAILAAAELEESIGVAQEYALAKAFYARALYLDAVSRFRRIVAMQPGDWANRYNLAVALLDAKQFSEAISLLRALSSERPTDAQLDTLLGSAYEASGDQESALVSYQAAVRAEPENPDCYLDYTRLLMDLNRYGEAVAGIQKGLSAGSDPYALQLRLGSIQLAQGQLEKARSTFRTAISLRPDVSLGYVAVAQSYLRDGNDAQARTTLEEARTHTPPDVALEYLLGLAYANSSMPEQARAAWKRAISIDGKLAEPWRALGTLELRHGNLDEARSDLEAAARLSPSQPETYFQLSRVYRRTGETESARSTAETAQRLMDSQRNDAAHTLRSHIGDLKAAPGWQSP